MPLTREQEHIVRLALDKASCPGDKKWSAGGLLAQIALLTGNTEAELKHWDEVANGDGPLTLDRIQESGNGFAGWPLDALAALDGAWRGGEGERALDALLHASTGQTEDKAATVAEPYAGTERRSAFTVAIDIKSLMFIAAVIGPLVAVITLVLQVRQDVRGNSIRATVLETRVQSLESRMAEQERAKTIFCAGRRAAMAGRDRGDSTTVRIPDAGC